MDNIELVWVIQDLVNNPQALARYKQDPAAYIKELGLPKEIQEQWLNLMTSPLEEVSTVFSLNLAAPNTTKQADTADSVIHLDGQWVTILAPTSPVVIEPTFLKPPDQCQLAPHTTSYIDVDSSKHVSFYLSVLFVDPKTQYPYIFDICTDDPKNPNPSHPLPKDTGIELNLLLPLVLTYEQTTRRELILDSFYNQSSNTLNLIFFRPSLLVPGS